MAALPGTCGASLITSRCIDKPCHSPIYHTLPYGKRFRKGRLAAGCQACLAEGGRRGGAGRASVARSARHQGKLLLAFQRPRRTARTSIARVGGRVATGNHPAVGGTAGPRGAPAADTADD